MSNAGSAFDAIDKDFEESIGGSPGALQILYDESNLEEMVILAEKAVLARKDGPLLYQRGGAIVHIVRRPATTIRGIAIAENTVAIAPVTADYLRMVFTSSAKWLRSDKRENKLKPASCPDVVSRSCMARDGEWPFPVLRSVIESPTLRSDGSVLQLPGYDQATGVYFDPGRTKFPKVPNRPTAAHVQQAREHYAELLCEFPFAEAHDLSVILAAIMTAIVRSMLPTVPPFGVSAPGVAEGKTAVAQLPSLISTGRPASVMQQPGDVAEEQKALLSVFFEGYIVVLIDNIEKIMRSPGLCSAVTSQTFAGRQLGRTGMLSVPNNALFIMTGVNLVLSGDLPSRTLISRLDSKCENPAERKFTRDIYTYAVTARPKLVWSALVLLRNFLVRGGAAASTLTTWNRFPEWSGLIRAALVFAGYPDPCESLRRIEREDPDRLQHAAVMDAWQKVFGNEHIIVKNLMDACNPVNAELRDSLLAVAGDREGVNINARSLGWWLRRHEDRVIGACCLKRAGSRAGQVIWTVIRV